MSEAVKTTELVVPFGEDLSTEIQRSLPQGMACTSRDTVVTRQTDDGADEMTDTRDDPDPGTG